MSIPTYTRSGYTSNSPAESFFSTLKRELVYQHDFESRESASRAIAKYIDEYYNYQRSHSYVGY